MTDNQERPGAVQLRLALRPEEPTRKVPVRMALDFDSEGTLIGVEILNLCLAGGDRTLEGLATHLSASMSFSYDREVDAFYLRVRRARSVDQRAVDGCLCLDASGSLVAIEAGFRTPGEPQN